MIEVLHLVLKSKCYEAIEPGEKRCEYRDKTPYWIRRILEKDPVKQLRQQKFIRMN